MSRIERPALLAGSLISERERRVGAGRENPSASIKKKKRKKKEKLDRERSRITYESGGRKYRGFRRKLPRSKFKLFGIFRENGTIISSNQFFLFSSLPSKISPSRGIRRFQGFNRTFERNFSNESIRKLVTVIVCSRVDGGNIYENK